jgi:hypothetical protein
MDEEFKRRLKDPEVVERLNAFLAPRRLLEPANATTREAPIPAWLLKTVMAEPGQERVRRWWYRRR